MSTPPLFHAVTLDPDKCEGCTICVRHCPTEAIRVREGKAKILAERCIDCGECIRVCPHHAKKAVFDKLEDYEGRFKWRVAIPAPALYGQFPNVEDIDFILTAIKRIGFDDVFEVSRAAEVVSDYSRVYFSSQNTATKPCINTACPAIVRLIRVRFPELCDNLLMVRPPIEVAEQMARAKAVKETGLPPDEIGIFFISPCPAKMTACRSPVGEMNSLIDGVLAINDLYVRISAELKKITDPEPLSYSGVLGIGWATSGGEAAALLREKYMATDGIDNCIKVLEEVENYKLNDLDFIELNACTGGCVGGVLTVANPFVAKARITGLRKYLPVSKNKFNPSKNYDMAYAGSLTPTPMNILHSDRATAMRMVVDINALFERLPKIDCGACGSPSCRTFAEDVISHEIGEDQCIFLLRDKLQEKYKDLPPDFLERAVNQHDNC